MNKQWLPAHTPSPELTLPSNDVAMVVVVCLMVLAGLMRLWARAVDRNSGLDGVFLPLLRAWFAFSVGAFNMARAADTIVTPISIAIGGACILHALVGTVRGYRARGPRTG